MLESMVIALGGTIIVSAIVVGLFIRGIRRRTRVASERQAAKNGRILADLRIAEVEYVITQIDRRLETLREEGDDAERGLAARLWDMKRLLGRVAEIDRVRVALADTCTRAVDEFRARSGERGVVLEMEEGIDDVWIEGDAELIEWGVRELLTNVDHHAGDWSRVEVRLETRTDSITLKIEDDGDGPDRSTASRLYGPFTPRTESPGPGLGLFTLFRAIRQMDGEMDHGIATIGGLSHTIRLPLAEGGAR